MPGKDDWFAAGLPREGGLASTPRVGDAASKDDITCGLEERLGDVSDRVRAAGKDAAMVITADLIVLGRIRGKALEGDPSAMAADVMDPGPTTTRTDDLLERTIERLRTKNVGSILVTNSDGKLVGTLYAERAEQFLQAYGEGEDECCCCNG